MTLEGGTEWESLFNGLSQTKPVVWTSAGQPIDFDSGAAKFEDLLRNTLFRCVQSGKLVAWLSRQEEDIRFIGLPSVLSDMFLGTGMRLQRRNIIRAEDI